MIGLINSRFDIRDKNNYNTTVDHFLLEEANERR